MAMFETNGVNIYYEDLGNKDSKNCVVFFNGAMSTVSSWQLLYPIFEKMGWRVVLQDFKGQFKSDKPAGPYTFEAHANEAYSLFKHLGLEQVHVIGTSYGGRVAMEFAILHPEITASISLINSLSELNTLSETIFKSWEAIRVAENGESFFWNAVPILYGKTFIANNKEECVSRAKFMGERATEYFDGKKLIFDNLLSNVYVTDRLCKITCPTLVVCGEEDILTPVALSEIIVQQIPHAEFVTIPDCGHSTLIEKPKELESIIFGFVMKHTF